MPSQQPVCTTEASADVPMPFVLSAAAMREADRATIEDFGIPGFTLMETAGRGAADHIITHYGPVAGKTIVCFCGKGNNGGDGFVVARVLFQRGARVHVYIVGDPDTLREDAAENWRLLEQLAEHDDSGRLALHRFENLDQLRVGPRPDLLVDALLGTGLTKELRPPIRDVVEWMNEQSQPTLALDIPTGLHADRGTVLGTAVRAAVTVTMGTYKTGLLINEGAALAGEIKVVDIGIPPFVTKEVAGRSSGCARLTTDEAVRTWLPRRPHDAHKYSAGMVLVVGGAPGLTGAPVMSALGAARAGAGYVTCACQERIQPILAEKLTEITTLALPASSDEGIDAERALEALSDRLAKAAALLVGPGLGRHPETQTFIFHLLEQTDLPVVIDADGLNALAETPEFVAEHAAGRWILTPHAGEFKRLAGDDVDLDDRVGIVQEHARKWNCVLILKGMPSVIGCPDGTAYINGTGNPALATAGTGDILAGLCAGFLAQGLTPERAAVCALHVGGAAADRYAADRHGPTMLATDLLDQLPLVLRERFS